MLAGSKKEKHFYFFWIARTLSSAAPIQRRVYQLFAEVYLWASAVFCARPSLQRNSIGTATKMRNPKLVGSLSMHQRSVSLPFHRKPIGTRTKMDNPKLVGGLSMSMHQLSGAGWPPGDLKLPSKLRFRWPRPQTCWCLRWTTPVFKVYHTPGV